MPPSENADPPRHAWRHSATLTAELAAPIWRVYQTWRRLDRFPSFVPFVRVANWTEPERLSWCEEHNGKAYKWTYCVKTDPGSNSVSWASLTGAENSGSVQCEPLPDG